jgi:drug/metabolite transporter (DMT)-like permease
MKPQLALALAVAAVSFAAPLIKLASAPPLAVSFYRLFFASVATFIFARGKTGLLIGRSLQLTVLAGVFLGLHFAVWIASLSYTSVMSSVVLVTLQPVLVALVSRLCFGEHISLQGVVGIGLALLGGLALAVFDLGGGVSSLYGDLLAFLGAVFVSLYFLLGRRVRQEVSTLSYTFWAYTVASATLLLLASVLRVPLSGFPGTDWLVFLALALVCTLLGHSVFNWSLAYLSATSVTVAILGEPLGASLWAYLIFGETPEPLQYAAGVLLLSGVCLYLSTEARLSSQRSSTEGPSLGKMT